MPRRKTPLDALLRLAWRESRTARRRLLLYMSSISLGVAALVAIDSFASNVVRSVHEQSRSLLGGDVSFASRNPWTPAADSLLDSLNRAGTPIARVTTFLSMGVIPRTGATRLVQIRAVTEGYPHYGTITTQPAGQWPRLQGGAHALVDPSLLITLDAKVGDTISVGFGKFQILGTLDNVPGDPGVAAIVGPRVFIPARYMAETGLLGFGSRAEFEALVKLPATAKPATWVAPLRPRLERARVRIRTVTENEMNLTQAIEQLSTFLGLVGLIALLLGGIGVASGVHAFVTRKIDTVAILRCLGATSRQVLLIYLVQAAAMGLVGAAVGAALGVLIQLALPDVIGSLLPVDVSVRLEPVAILAGLAVGVWVALVFALLPLLALRRVSPLQAIRRESDDAVLGGAWQDGPRVLTYLALVASVFGLASTRADRWQEAVGMSIGIAVVVGVLVASAGALSWIARRLVRRGWPYVVRQGVANLYRPANQTRAVVLSLGFGAFLVSTLYLVQNSLLAQFTVTAASSRGNMVFFDVQDDQVEPLAQQVAAAGHQVVQRTPIVTMRIAAINDVPTDTLSRRRRNASWALRREYRSTFRDSMETSEQLTGGKWFGAASPGDTIFEMSFERDVARDLGLKLGDRVTWNVQGVPVRTRVTSFRTVNWSRFEPNFFAVFQPAALEGAPKSHVLLAQVPRNAVPALQRESVRRFPNVSSIDLSLILDTINRIIERVSVAVRFMAVFSLAMGVPVLFSAVAATRRARVREGVLLKVLGATRAQIGRILLSEYTLLGLLGSATGMALSYGGAWALTKWVFRTPFAPAWGPTFAIAGAMLGLTVGIGLMAGRDVFRETPMAALREA